MFDNVVVGIDGRSGGRDAVALAKQLAAGDARITLAHVYGGTTMGGRASALAVPLELEASEQLLARAAADASVHTDTEVVYESSVGRGLHDLAECREADLLVVGSCHRGMLGRTVLGDDTGRALDGAPCAVAIAPRGYAAAGFAARSLSRIGVGCDVSAESAWALEVARALAARHGSTIKALSVVSLRRWSRCRASRTGSRSRLSGRRSPGSWSPTSCIASMTSRESRATPPTATPAMS